MRFFLLPALLLLIASCSCSRKPDQEVTLATTATLPAAPTPSPAEQAAKQRHLQLQEQERRNLAEANRAIQAYLAALTSGQRAKADAMWIGGKPPPTTGDEALRSLEPRSARIETDTPKSLTPDELPSRNVEIPVHLQLMRANGTIQKWDGWYRIRRKITNDGWEISTASMHVQID